MKNQLLDFIWFFLTFILIVNIFTGDFLDIFNWSSPGAAGAALMNLLGVFGAFMLVTTVILPALRNRKNNK